MAAPLQLPDFLNAPIQRALMPTPNLTRDYSGITNFIPQALQAYQTPFQMRHERMMNQEKYNEQAMKNALTKQYGEQEKEAEIASKLAYAQYMNMGGAHGAGGGLDNKLSMAMWRSLPQNERTEIAATLRGAGVPVDEGVRRMMNGETINEIVESYGKDINETERKYAATASNVTQIKNAEGAEAELQSINNKVTPWLSKYSRTIKGYSPNQIVDAIKGGNPDEQAKFLAGRALQPELAGIRTRILGGSTAHQALKEVKDVALGNFKVFSPLISPEVYEKTQKYIDEAIEEGFKARKESVYGLNKSSSRDEMGAEHQKINQMMNEKYKQREEKLTIKHPAIQSTAKKYGITPQQVLQEIERRS